MSREYVVMISWLCASVRYFLFYWMIAPRYHLGLFVVSHELSLKSSSESEPHFIVGGGRFGARVEVRAATGKVNNSAAFEAALRAFLSF
jgi:hypothetical protein